MKNTSLFCRSACVAVLGALSVVPAHAAIFTVSTVADNGPGSLRRAINEANKTPEQDRILFSIPAVQRRNGIWKIDLQTQLPPLAHPLRIVGPGASELTLTIRQPEASIFFISRLDGPPPSDPAVGTNYFSGMTLRDARGIAAAVRATRAKIEFSDVVFRNNQHVGTVINTGGGGAVSNDRGISFFRDCEFVGNSAPAGGAFHSWLDGSATFMNCSFRRNEALGSEVGVAGGAIWSQGDLTLYNCEFDGNEAKWGSAVWQSQGSDDDPTTPRTRNVTISGSTFQNNRAVTSSAIPYTLKGTIYNEDANVSIGATTFYQNSMTYGGAIYNNRGNINVRRSTFFLNTALTGSVLQTSGGKTNLFNCTMVSNGVDPGNTIDHDAESTGNPETLIANCTFHLNSSTPRSAEFGIGSGTISVINTIVNIVGDGKVQSQGSGELISLGHNLVNLGGNSNHNLYDPTDITGQAPKFASFTPVENGGPTLTLALKPTSPAINAGDNAVLGAPYNLSVDQRGFARRSGARVDIGAFEVQQPAATRSGPSGQTF